MSFKEDGYVHVKDVLPENLYKLFTQYTFFNLMNDVDDEFLDDETAQVPGTHSVYADNLMESLLIFLQPIVEKYTGLNVIPTYSYYRLYKHGDILHPHKDRPSCEISMSLTLDYNYNDTEDDYKWPIIMGNNSISMERGDAVIYRGCDIEHQRPKLNVGSNSYHAQVFLHYVDANGPYTKEYKYDKRPSVGIKPTTLQKFRQKNIIKDEDENVSNTNVCQSNL